MIEIKGLTKQYGFNLVLRGIDLSVDAGEFITVVGANGAGKSTLLRILATLLNPSTGEIKIGGWPLPNYASQVRRHIGLVSHQSLLYSDLTAVENLRFFAQLYGLDNQEERVKQGLKLVGLTSRQRDPVRTFSRGMLQRLTIARATLHEPDILLLDEPYTGLDQDASQLLDELLLRESANGRTIIMITHDLLHGLKICDRILILNRGKIAKEIRTEESSNIDLLTIYEETTRKKRVN